MLREERVVRAIVFGFFGILLLLVTYGYVGNLIAESQVPADPYEAIHSIEVDNIWGYLDDYRKEGGSDGLAARLQRVFTESMRLRTFNSAARFCIREGMLEFQPLIVKRLEQFKAIPRDSTWYTYNGQHYEENGSISDELATLEKVLIEEGWYR